jgi:ERI1 exoribonuclease 3
MASEDGKRGMNWDESVSRALSRILRHSAEKDGLKVQPDGFVLLEEVLKVPIKVKPMPSVDDVKRIVATNDKQRFALKTTDDGVLWIRANQGHSLAGVETAQLLKELTLEDVKTLPAACHGTYEEAWKIIEKKGLSRMSRRHIHIASEYLGSKNTISGMRGNVQVLIHIDLAAAMQGPEKIRFFMSDNNVILTEGDQHGQIPPKYFAKIEHIQPKSTKNKKHDKNNKTNKNNKHDSSAPSKQERKSGKDNVLTQPTQATEKSSTAASTAASTASTQTTAAVGPTAAARAVATVQEKTGEDVGYLMVLDFEATCGDAKGFKPFEITEFPILVMRTSTGEIVDQFHEYVRPVVNPKLTEFCTKLTGIEQSTVDLADPFLAVWKRANTFIETKVRTLVGGQTATFVTCGDWDLETMLPAQLKLSDVNSVPAVWKRWINIKQVFADHYKLPKTAPNGMVGMLNHLQLTLEGRHHSGIDDCKNIARILQTLLKAKHEAKHTTSINKYVQQK